MSGTQAGRVEVAGARAGALRPRARPPGKEEDDTRRWPGGLGRKVRPRWVSLSLCFLFLFLFSISLHFVLI